jgi:hypothetical protein
MVAEKVHMQIPVLIHRETNLFDIGRSIRYRLMTPSDIVFIDYYEEEIYQGIRLGGREEVR